MSVAAEEMSDVPALLQDEPMARHTSWRVGGPADLFFKPSGVDELASFLATLAGDVPVHFIGLGSNLLVRDGGIRGAVVCTSALPKDVTQLDDERVRAAAGLSCTTLARRCLRWKLGPAAFLAGIPGTVGGALAMNAGAFGGETWDNVERVTTIDRSGAVHTRPRAQFSSGYRNVSGPEDEWFLDATFRFEAEDAAGTSTLRAMLRKRGDTQPLGRPSAGSVFRNPPGNFAGRLIEQAGLKGARVGGAKVSGKHANFIINNGSATAADIEHLIEQLRSEVAQRTGVALELEVHVLGEHAGETG